MQKNDLIKLQGSVYRILEIRENSVLTVDCLHQSMPTWIDISKLQPFSECSEQEMHDITARII